MDTANEKKWFVYMEDHHEGPFSLTDVQTKISDGTVRKDQYIWAEGMPDWKPMAEVSDFQFLFLPPAGSKSPAKAPFLTGEVAALGPAADSHGLPGLEVPIQTMMEQSLEQRTGGAGALTPPAGAEIVVGMEALGGADAGPTLLTEAVEPSLEIGMPPATASDQGPSLAELPHDDFTDASQAAVKKAKEETVSFADRSRNIESLVSAKQEPSYGTQTREHVALVQQGPQVGGGTNRFKRFLKFVLFVGCMGGLGYAYYQGHLDPVLQNPAVREQARKALDLAQPAVAFVVEKVPFLGQFLSPIPHLRDVSPQDYEDLRLAASAPLSSSGPAAAVALATGDGRVARFYVSSNLPDGAALVVHVEGVPETLLNATDFNSKLPVTLAKRLAETQSVVQADGSPIPKGEYNIFVYEADQQPDAVKAILDSSKTSASDKLPRVLGLSKKVGSAKKYFLGGVRDRDYDERLKKYQVAVRERARLDYEELFQVYTTLVSQYNASFTRMQDARLKMNKVKASPAGHGKGAKSLFASIQRKWLSDSAGWVRMQTQLGKFGNWTPEFLKATVYPHVFDQMKRIGEAVTHYHATQAAFFGNPLDPALETKVDEVQKQTQGLFYELGPKIKKIQESLAKPDGLPAKVD